MSYRELTICRCCGGADLMPYLDLGQQPLANSYHHGETLPAYPLQLVLCTDCFHSQLSVVVDPRALFTSYLYVSGTTRTLREHFTGLVEDALARVDRKRPRVLDIACNDGTLLECFRWEGADVIGVDPAANLKEVTEEKGIPVISAFWDVDVAAQVGGVDVITATNVFAHVHDVEGFLEACRGVLQPGGLIVVEFPYCRRMILGTEYDTIYHEHLSYFLIGPVALLARRLGFQIEDLSRWPIHGGSVRLFLRDARAAHGAAVESCLREEQEQGFATTGPYLAFAQRVLRSRERLVELLNQLADDGHRVVGYGASAKGNTMLNFCRLTLPYIVDDNPLKWGYQTPGRDIAIQAPETLRAEQDGLHLLLLAWNFSREILNKVKAIRPGKRDFTVRYIPEVVRDAIDADLACVE